MVDKIYFKLGSKLNVFKASTNFLTLSHTEADTYVLSNTKYRDTVVR